MGLSTQDKIKSKLENKPIAHVWVSFTSGTGIINVLPIYNCPLGNPHKCTNGLG